MSATPGTLAEKAASTTFCGAVVVPIMDENIRPLIEGVKGHPQIGDQSGLHEQALKLGAPLLVIFVDDSKSQWCVQMSNQLREELCGGACEHLVIKHLHRTGEMRHGGLSGAVTDGIELANKLGIEKIVVMDGDSQHPPKYVPELFKELDHVDLVATTRRGKDGSSEGLNGFHRHLVSRGSTILAKSLFPRLLRGISDPMTGYFGLNCSSIDRDTLTPRGFKILVEVLLTHPKLKRSEVEFKFGPRLEGESNSSLKQGWDFLWQLTRHRVKSEKFNFALGGGSIALLGIYMLHVTVQLGLSERLAYGIMLFATVTLNFLYNRYFTFGEVRNKQASAVREAIGFVVSRGATIGGSFAAFWLLTDIGVHYQVANISCLLAATCANYWTSKRIFGGRAASILTRKGGKQ